MKKYKYSFIICVIAISIIFSNQIAYGESNSTNEVEIVKIAAGSRTSYAVDENGILWGWGDNENGQLLYNNILDKYTPTKLMEDVVDVGAGLGNCYVIKKDHTLWAWGFNGWGGSRLGDGTTITRRKPVKIMDDVKKIYVSYSQIALIKLDDSLWMWGKNDDEYSILGDGTEINRSYPVKIMDDVKDFTFAISNVILKTDGSLWHVNKTSRKFEYFDAPISNIVEIGQGYYYLNDKSSLYYYNDFLKKKELIATNVIKIFDGQGGAYYLDNNYVLWGRGTSHALLGVGTTEVAEEFVKILENVDDMTYGGEQGIALLNDGTLKTWGYNKNGSTGQGTDIPVYEPTIVLFNKSENIYYENYADKLNKLGLFSGVGVDENNSPIFDLQREPTRQEAITMLVRLLGKEKQAKNGVWKHPFNDVDDWAQPYVGFAYENNLTKGISNNVFGSNDKVTEPQYLTFILRALGYNEGEDFTWDNPYEITKSMELTSENQSDIVFNRGSIAKLSFLALRNDIKDLDKRLIDLLYESGVVSMDKIKLVGLDNTIVNDDEVLTEESEELAEESEELTKENEILKTENNYEKYTDKTNTIIDNVFHINELFKRLPMDEYVKIFKSELGVYIKDKSYTFSMDNYDIFGSVAYDEFEDNQLQADFMIKNQDNEEFDEFKKLLKNKLGEPYAEDTEDSIYGENTTKWKYAYLTRKNYGNETQLWIRINEEPIGDKLTVDEIEYYLKDNFRTLNTNIGTTEFTFEISENDSTRYSYDYWVRVGYEYDYFGGAMSSIKYTKEQKDTLKEELKAHQKNIAQALIKLLPNKKLAGGYYDSWYLYPALKLDLQTRRYYSWRNYDTDALYYDEANPSYFRWNDSIDDYLVY